MFSGIAAYRAALRGPCVRRHARCGRRARAPCNVHRPSSTVCHARCAGPRHAAACTIHRAPFVDGVSRARPTVLRAPCAVPGPRATSTERSASCTAPHPPPGPGAPSDGLPRFAGYPAFVGPPRRFSTGRRAHFLGTTALDRPSRWEARPLDVWPPSPPKGQPPGLFFF
jgi:hypothetical protein